MGGWADGVKARELGTGIDNTMVWVGYKESGGSLMTTLSIADGWGQQVWAVMDEQAWLALRREIDAALQTLRDDRQERGDA